MENRFPAFVLVASLLAFAAGTVSFSNNNAYGQADDTWYIGEGAVQDMYVKYRIQELDTNNGRPYEMTIYFQKQQDGDWIAPTFVVDQGRVYKGTLVLGNNLAPLSGGADIPPEMADYIGGYRGSLQWLEAFSPQSAPLSLNQRSWGKIAAIGGEEVRPMGQESITVPAGTYDTTLIGWHRGQVDNKIWVLNEFPYPVRAETFADVTTGVPPTLFEFELLETGMGQPEAPAEDIIIPEPPLTRTTPQGTYDVQLDWEPVSIEPGQEVTFGISFFDSTGFPLERVSYNFIITDANGTAIEELTNQFADDGTAQHQITFEDSGPARMTVTINSVSGQPASRGGFVEGVDYNLVVVPEFPISAAIVAGAVVGLMVLLTRARGTSFGGVFGSKGGRAYP